MATITLYGAARVPYTEKVRRALLSNPRMGLDQIMRVLRLLPKHELKLAAIQTAYAFAVRDAARKMLRED